MLAALGAGETLTTEVEGPRRTSCDTVVVIEDVIRRAREAVFVVRSSTREAGIMTGLTRCTVKEKVGGAVIDAGVVVKDHPIHTAHTGVWTRSVARETGGVAGDVLAGASVLLGNRTLRAFVDTVGGRCEKEPKGAVVTAVLVHAEVTARATRLALFDFEVIVLALVAWLGALAVHRRCEVFQRTGRALDRADAGGAVGGAWRAATGLGVSVEPPRTLPHAQPGFLRALPDPLRLQIVGVLT